MILLTHSFLGYEGKRFITENYQMQDVNYAEALWQKLVYPSDNIKLVICGHECHITDYAQQVSFRTDKNHSGNEVAQMMFNAQTADGQWFGNGGDCWLRILEFKPDGKQFQYVLSLPYLPFLQRPANMHGVNNPLISLI